MASIDLGTLPFDRGGRLLVEQAIGTLSLGENLQVSGLDPALDLHLGAWARRKGHQVERGSGLVLIPGRWAHLRGCDVTRAGDPGRVSSHAPASWGFAARGALLEAGGPAITGFDLDRSEDVWTELAPKLYAQAVANQWDPARAVNWTAPDLPPSIEAAVVQTMTYLVENEQVALTVSARFLGRVHPHFREIAAFLATQAADEARHVDVFMRRAGLRHDALGVSASGGRVSLQTLLDEPDWANASFLLSVLGEGSFLALLSFLWRYAPDPVTAQVAQLVTSDEARHVAFAMGHLRERVLNRNDYRDRLRAALERRHHTLTESATLSPAVHESLVLIAAGSWAPESIETGWRAVEHLQEEMLESRCRRLTRLGFTSREADEMAALHTPNFM